ncbi:MAG TPA: organomercurial lyase [Candidatus Polarisedimenticolaceae bacterium]|nr:organomercurial lyase [Candidatus Polarisedimenticolaceae bacterium]
MDVDVAVKLAIYHHFAETGSRPSPDDVGARIGTKRTEALAAYERLRQQRVLVLEGDGASIRMAPPFSGVPTQHVVEADGIRYYANCAWDSLGIPAALRKPALVRSRCEQTKDPLVLEVESEGPESSSWLFHCAVPAARWWDDIVFT